MITASEGLLPGIKLIELKTHIDNRGFFTEVYRRPLYEGEGIVDSFVQDNHSFSRAGVIRGMHFQTGSGQAKLISVISGRIYDVFVDVRPGSPHFGQWSAVELTPSRQVYIPAGFAHGFAALEDSHILYKVSTPYNSMTEATFSYSDPAVGIDWPIENPIVSPRDEGACSFAEAVR